MYKYIENFGQYIQSLCYVSIVATLYYDTSKTHRFSSLMFQTQILLLDYYHCRRASNLDCCRCCHLLFRSIRRVSSTTIWLDLCGHRVRTSPFLVLLAGAFCDCCSIRFRHKSCFQGSVWVFWILIITRSFKAHTHQSQMWFSLRLWPVTLSAVVAVSRGVTKQ